MTHRLFGSSAQAVGDEIVRERGTRWITLLPKDIEEFSVDQAFRGLVMGSDE
tara:strand:- start:297 stop:452 length:156 start_codon:yes stop_codon:yes gene_type:complete